ncbi:dermonecrotic toxin domain-containing protein [Pseudomonas poae]|uniref:Dermonecrotic toxin N-terminal domain-containing protein n=1 Tax=Pseudomonas poae TaxID=200451 RepID=A0A2S9EW36_9PSED|nr:DUF6543 domain-containing protein [Pseudomonas poae]PRA28920.1 hypothetical protein CQZ97_14930 [Pseudomonas poae]PRC20617.1 hypothetical protein CQZ99_08175 [Pseudomonas poae]
MTIATNTSPRPLPQSFAFSTQTAPNGDTHNTPANASNDTQAARPVSPQESALVESYVGVVERKAVGKIPGRVTVAPQTLLGQWLELYRAQLEHPVVQNWMREQKIDVKSVSVNPSTGTLSADVDGLKKSFSLTDGSGWRQISGPLLEAAKVLVPAADQNLQVRANSDSFDVSAKLVASFYGEKLPTNLSQARSQIRRPEQNKHFDPIASDDPQRPASKRSEHALALQKNNAARFYAAAPQKLGYEKLALDVARAMPDVRAEAKKWAEALILKLTGQHVDADQIYLNRFSASQSASSATGWEHMAEEPTVSLRLPDALLKNFSEHDGIPGELDRQAGLYKDGPGKSEQDGYGAHNQFPLAPSALMHESWKTDFQTQMTQKIDTFWSTHTDAYETAIKGEFAYQARRQLKTAEARSPAERALQAPEHQFTREDYRLLMGAVSNLPLDEHAPFSVEQLKAKAPVKGVVQAHALNIHGFTSNDIVRFSAADGGRQVLYIPGAEPAFLRFDSLEKLDQWVTDQTKHPKKREALVAHFPLAYRQDHEASFAARAARILIPAFGLAHIGDKTEGLDTLFDKIATGKLQGPAINDSHSKIEGDVFSTLAAASKERMASDADVVIKSNSEVTRDTWLNDITVAAGLLAKLAPLAAPVTGAAAITGLTELSLGAEKSSSGDTEAERKDGTAKAFDGVLNTLFAVTASGAVEDPFVPTDDPLLPPDEPLIDPIPEEAPRIERPQPLPEINRLRPIHAGNISQHAIPEGEQTLENAVRNAKGIYQTKDAITGADQWYIRYTDAGGVPQVYEIKSDFKLSNDYVQIVDPATGKTVLTVHSDGEGGWVRTAANGGVRWPWQRTPSPAASENLTSQFSDLFADMDAQAAKQAEKFDEHFKVDETKPYVVSTRGYEENHTLKRMLNISWEAAEGKVDIYPSEKAASTEYSTSAYSPNFILDLNRNDYTVIKASKGGDITLPLSAGGDSAEAIRQNRVRQFEQAIPDEELRARISEVAHQGSVYPANAELLNTLKEGYGAKAKNTAYFIDYDPLKNETQVRVVAKWYVNDLTGDNPREIPELEATTTRTFTIRESNEISGSTYTIDEFAPTHLEVSVPADLPQ